MIVDEIYDGAEAGPLYTDRMARYAVGWGCRNDPHVVLVATSDLESMSLESYNPIPSVDYSLWSEKVIPVKSMEYGIVNKTFFNQ